MGIKLYGLRMSTCTQRVLTVLLEKDLPYEFVELDFAKAEQKSAAHLARQPFGKVPALEDDGFMIYESRAISKYLAKKYASQGTKLVPSEDDFKGYGLLEQAASMEQSYFAPGAEGIAFERLFKKFRGLEADEAKVEQHAAALDAALAVYDKILANQTYLAGNELTVADLSHLPYARIDKMVGYAELYNKYPNVKRWIESLEARESWKKVTAE